MEGMGWDLVPGLMQTLPGPMGLLRAVGWGTGGIFHLHPASKGRREQGEPTTPSPDALLPTSTLQG